MRALNVFGMAAIAVLVVIVAFVGRHASSAEPTRIWLSGLEAPLKEMIVFRRQDGLIEEAAKFTHHQGAIGLLRMNGAALPADRAASAVDPDAFLEEAKRRFKGAADGATPVALAPRGRLAAGFVTRIRASDGYCDFGVAAYSAKAFTGVVALVRIIICDPTGGLTPPDVRLAGLLTLAEDAS